MEYQSKFNGLGVSMGTGLNFVQAEFGRLLAFFFLASTSVVALAEPNLLFEDNFASGDLSNHNEYFRWGRGDIPSAGSGSSVIVEVPGPTGEPTNALKFEYAALGTGKNSDDEHWKEQRFHLTRETTEERTGSGASDVAFPEIWIRYSMRVPANYYHRLTDGSVAGANNKGWVTIWKNSYQGSDIHARLTWWPTGSNWGQAEGRSTVGAVSQSGGSVDQTPSFISDQVLALSPRNEKRMWAFTPSNYGAWVDFAFRFRAASGPTAKDGVIEIWKNGTLAGKWEGRNIWPEDNDPSKAGFDRGYIMGYHNSGYSEDTIFYIANFKVGTTAESVGLGPKHPFPPNLLHEEGGRQ